MDVARCAQLTSRLGHRRFLVLAPGNARARQSDASVALATGGYADMGTAAAPRHEKFPTSALVMYRQDCSSRRRGAADHGLNGPVAIGEGSRYRYRDLVQAGRA